MILPIAKIKSSIEDYENTPEGGKYQFIDFEIIEMPSPTPQHQEVTLNLCVMLRKYVLENNLGKVYISPMDVQFDIGNVLQPDILFLSNAKLNIAQSKRINGSPDLVVEVLSESSAYFDFKKKKAIYEHHSVKEYWIVDAQTKSIEVLENSITNGFVLIGVFNEGKVFQSNLFIEFKPNLVDVFI